MEQSEVTPEIKKRKLKKSPIKSYLLKRVSKQLQEFSSELGVTRTEEDDLAEDQIVFKPPRGNYLA